MNPFQRCRGEVLQTTLHVVLLALVLGQVVFLASRAKLRADLTSDRLYSLTGSTRRVLDSLDKRLVVEAYFSDKEKLPGQWRDGRVVLDNFLDELVQMGRGRVAVQRFDPLSDKTISDKCTRLGIKPIDLTSGSTSSINTNRNWQGLRLVYGGEKQKVIEQVPAATAPQLELLITPAIKEVITKEKHKVGFMEWPVDPASLGAQPNQGPTWAVVRTLDEVSKRYEFQSYKDQEGVLIPPECDTLLLFRPKELTDRQKYVVDQFVMRGGNLVVFAKGADYAVGQNRTFVRYPVELDQKGSQTKFIDQLQHYGIDLRQRVVADGVAQATQSIDPREYMAVVRINALGQQMPQGIFYPYFFHAVATDWRQTADQLATDRSTGSKDQEKADQYRRIFHPGIDSDEMLWTPYRQKGRGPGLYWPCWVDIKRKAGGDPDLPPGIDGRVHLWSSPITLVQDPPPNLNPMQGQDPQAQNASVQKFIRDFNARMGAEPRQQAPLMAEVRGKFSSFFAGKERPKKASEIAAEEEAKKQAAEQAEKDPLKEPVKDKPDAAKPEPPKKDVQGPQPAKDKDKKDAKQEPEPAMVTEATAPGRIVVIGDADFLRDDYVRGDYAQRGGPVSFACSQFAPHFMPLLLDWLAQDRDLLDLQSRAPLDRGMHFATLDVQRQEDQRSFELRRDSVQGMVQWLNILVPTVVFAALGIAVFLVRRAQKRAFLATVN